MQTGQWWNSSLEFPHLLASRRVGGRRAVRLLFLRVLSQRPKALAYGGSSLRAYLRFPVSANFDLNRLTDEGVASVSLPEARMGSTVRQNGPRGKFQASTSRRYAQNKLMTAQSWGGHRPKEVFAHRGSLDFIFLLFGDQVDFPGRAPSSGNGDVPD